MDKLRARDVLLHGADVPQKFRRLPDVKNLEVHMDTCMAKGKDMLLAVREMDSDYKYFLDKDALANHER